MSKGLVICTLCQRVRRGRDWVEMGQVIRELRTFELDSPPELHAVICEKCVDALLRRRAESGETLAE